jgi:hypothetical protein
VITRFEYTAQMMAAIFSMQRRWRERPSYLASVLAAEGGCVT